MAMYYAFPDSFSMDPRGPQIFHFWSTNISQNLIC